MIDVTMATVKTFVTLATQLLLYNMDVSCHRPFLPGTSLEQAVIPTSQASSFTLQYSTVPYYCYYYCYYHHHHLVYAGYL